ncbi:hypothetical protein [Sphingosinicella sp.]|uniref:hypothetical protein n=1 Tax=Sphingosinicella sp. TaxID=1917971 RepID=UPI0035ADECCC
MRHIESNAIARLLLVAFVAIFLKPAFGAHASEKNDSWRVSPTTEQADGTALIKRQLHIGGRHTIRYIGIMSDRIYAGPFGGQWPPAADPFMDWMYYQWWAPISISNDEGAGTEKALPAFVAAVTEGAGYLHALLISGAYDIATPYFAAEYAARKVPLAYKDNVVVLRYAGGHMTTGREFDAEVLGFINRVMATPAPSRPLGPLEE